MPISWLRLPNLDAKNAKLKSRVGELEVKLALLE
jgi:hypothetical protein